MVCCKVIPRSADAAEVLILNKLLAIFEVLPDNAQATRQIKDGSAFRTLVDVWHVLLTTIELLCLAFITGEEEAESALLAGVIRIKRFAIGNIHRNAFTIAKAKSELATRANILVVNIAQAIRNVLFSASFID